MSFSAAELDLLLRFSVALAIGLLIGIERGWQERAAAAGERTAGIRTFSLMGLLGALGGALHETAGPWPLTALLLAAGGAVAFYKFREGNADRDFSVTGVIAALLVMALGAYAMLGQIVIAAAVGVGAAILLAARQSLHHWLARLTWPELRSGLTLLAMTVIALPLLPEGPVDPFGVLDLREIWVLTILIAALSAAGYVAVKIAGPARGLLFGSAAGGLVSSTAVTLANARLAKGGWGDAGPGWSTGLANAISLARMALVASTFAPGLALPLAVTLVPGAIAMGLLSLFGWWLTLPQGRAARDMPLDNPFELATVLKFGLLLGGLIVVSKLLSDILGTAGLYALAFVTGLVDVDSIALASAKLFMEGIGDAALIAIFIAAASNLFAKSLIGIFVAGWGFGSRVMAGGLAAALAAWGTWTLVRAGAFPGL